MTESRTANYEELLDRVKAMYRRLSERKLLNSDILDADKAVYPDTAQFMRAIHANQPQFESYFAAFANTYDVFRIFSAQDVILDVGAHWGYSALAMRRRGAKAKVFSIEAMPHNARVLAVLKELEKGRYDFVENAATEKVEELEFFIPAMNGVANTGSSSTGGTLSDPFAFILADLAKVNPAPLGMPDKPQIIKRQVLGKPLDQIATEQGLMAAVAAIKMDVEGHEAQALRGAKGLLAKNRPLVMVEGANRDPGVQAAFAGTGYRHYERHAGKLILHEALSEANDGFWVHDARVPQYAAAGLL